MKKKTDKLCPECGNWFTRANSLIKWCSPKCQANIDKKRRDEKKKRMEWKINIQIQGLNKEESREVIKKQLRKFIPDYIETRKVVIKISRPKVRTELQILKGKLDKIFSKYIRERDKHTCVVCWSKDNPNNWHFITRSCLSLRFDEINCNCQCASCNKTHEQFTKPYEDFMINKYGKEKVEELHQIYMWSPLKLNTDWYKEKIEEYNQKLKDLLR